jgi:xylulokinase
MTVSVRDDCVLAIDHGTSGIKAAVVTAGGVVVDFECVPTAIRFLAGGGAEQDPDDWWQALLLAAGRVVQRGAVPPAAITAMCVSSTFSTTVAVDRDGRHLRPALTWMDGRGAPYVRQAMHGVPSVMGYGVAKAVRWLRRTGGAPSLSGKDDAGHVLLVKHAWPEVYARTQCFLPSKDYLNLRLTGELASSFDAMHLFWVSDLRDPQRIRYDDKLLRTLGIDRDKLPPMRASTDVLGTLRGPVAEAIGVRRDVRVVTGSPDHQCALFGSGAVRDFAAHLYVGTSSWIECLVPFRKTDPFHSIATLPTAVAGKYQVIDEQDLAGGALGFLADNILFRRHAILGVPVPEQRYTLLDAIAAAVPPGSHRVLFTPWLNGERTPVDDPHLRGGFHNLSTTTTLEDMVRAVLEGVAFNTAWMLAYVERFVRRRLEPIRIVGGGAQSAVWCQIFADVLRRDIEAVADPVQANARGAAFIAAMGLGWLRLTDIPSLVPVARRYTPRPEVHSTYAALYDAFRRLHTANAPVLRRLNRDQGVRA